MYSLRNPRTGKTLTIIYFTIYFVAEPKHKDKRNQRLTCSRGPSECKWQILSLEVQGTFPITRPPSHVDFIL